MLNLTVDNWQYLHGEPLVKATLKQELSDFQVNEILSFEPSGNGEHTFLHIEKTGLNTAFVAEEIAKFAKIPLRAVSYAGRKDKYATTSQWFGVYFGGKQHASRKSSVVKPADIDWSALQIEGLRILNVTYNDKKLRLGAIKENQFTIVLRNMSEFDHNALTERIALIEQKGVPNYFGNQRFGELIKADGSVQLGGNLALAEKLVNGEDIRNRNKKSMAVSALRSWLFNHFVSYRLANTQYMQVFDGDVLSLSGSNSFFIHEQNSEQSEETLKRLNLRDVNITAPLWGKGKLDAKAQALVFEHEKALEHEAVCEALVNLGLEQQRRPILVFPKNLSFEVFENTLTLKFSLPSGCFATSVIREIAEVSTGKR